MSKAILVIDMPESCFYCDCCHTRDYDPKERLDGEKYCGIEDMDVDSYYTSYYDGISVKPDWCPLKALPKEKEEYLSINNEKGYCEGWNACVNKILGE